MIRKITEELRRHIHASRDVEEGRALSTLCLWAFWGDERSLVLLDSPGAKS